MEGVAAASSILTVLSLVGHSIEGVVNLRDFFVEVSVSLKTVDSLLLDLNTLIQTLFDVQNYLKKLESMTEISQELEVTTIASFRGQLESCNKHVIEWLLIARDLRIPSDQGSKAWLRSLRVFFNQNTLRTMREGVDKHRQAFLVSLALLGRWERRKHVIGWLCLSANL